MDKFTVTFAKTFAIALAIMIGSLVIGCKSTTEPESSQEYDSEAAADITAASLGTESGGAGVSLADVKDLADGKDINGIVSGKASPSGKDASYNDTTGMHTLTVTRSGGDGNKFSFTSTIVYQYIYFDASGKFMEKFQKGVTDSIWVKFSKEKSKDITERVDIDNSANGEWNISKLTSIAPVFNGTFTRNGTDVFHTVKNGDKTFTHSFSITFDNDLIVKDSLDGKKHVYLEGPATSHFEVTTPKYTFVRDTKITFNGDGTATLEITRTSGDGTVDTYTIDVKVGKFKAKIR